jgi:mannose-6-phosphate isomerase-like protein (cupin superfamily)
MIKTRIIETAIDHKGDSYIFSDKEQTGWDLGGHTITDLFFSKKCPPDMLETDQEMENKNFNLKPGQLRFFRSDVPPTRPLYDKLPKNEKPENFKELFYHSTTTVDYIIVVKGELVMIVGQKEVTLKAGDVVIQRGAAHAWHNYTSENATIMGIMIGVELPKQFKRTDTIQPD